MMIDPIYGIAKGTPLVAKAPGSGQASGASTADFSSILGDTIAGMANQLRQAEATSIAGLKGMASTQEVVEQVMAAEQTLQASIAVRDKIVSAYLEISHMTI